MQAGNIDILKDLYGFEVNLDYSELLQTYSPIWIASEAKSERSWRLFLNSVAEQLGLRTPGEATTHSGQAFGHLCSAVLQQLAAQQAPEILMQLVRGGIPNSLRPYAWPAFLRAHDRCPCSQYGRLWSLHQGNVWQHLPPTDRELAITAMLFARPCCLLESGVDFACYTSSAAVLCLCMPSFHEPCTCPGPTDLVLLVLDSYCSLSL
jgi:hypothetical protein